MTLCKQGEVLINMSLVLCSEIDGESDKAGCQIGTLSKRQESVRSFMDEVSRGIIAIS